MTVEPSRSIEIERTFDVEAETPLPDLWTLPGVASVSQPELRELDALYLDVYDYALGRAGYALRRRTGGPDEGWHLKGPRSADGSRVELHWPLGESEDIPEALATVVSGVVAGELSPIARIRNTRNAYHLRDVSGGVIAEFVDDRVRARDERQGVDRAWREWEFELGAAAPADAVGRTELFAAVEAAVRRVGGAPAASPSKLGRALGL
ncbi:CYTH domain-containing protein [Microbacterium sp. No. 7]|uniref:CYTH domain-containing protein n=1 Tax=Microbacterium sp. No. 7 TaxID=1714373 RepID=UPI0006D1C1BB|nr:CYTH domain-containing protein [Microbacterium sp. No. 7]ALJ20835.1 adenylate cyclase [Microbacterium sp. No. 7]